MNLLESIIATFSPAYAVRRAQARRVLAAYEAAKPSTLRKMSRDSSSGDRWVAAAGNNLRNQARHLDANHDLAKGVLNAIVNNVVGANGITIEPQPRNVAGEILDDLADQLLTLFKDWERHPECTKTENWSSTQRLLCRSWIRDGEVLVKQLVGGVPNLAHNTVVPYSLEMVEADYLPLIYDDPAKNITQGIRRNGWGRPTKYYLYRNHPGDISAYTVGAQDLREIDADRILHLRTRERISQLRGVSVFAPVMTRLDDIKDYEESERIAAKIAASMAAVIKKGAPDLYEPAADGQPRSLRFQPGMVFDDLLPGETIETIDTNRPNPQLVEYRKGQLRAVAAGTGVNYSTIARDYDGSYSSQRQELIEGWTNYEVLTDEFIKSIVQPVWEEFVRVAEAASLIKVPMDIDRITLDDALYIGPSMPWIDPLKEIKGNVVAERAGYISGPEVIRKSGRNPRDVLEQSARWRRAQKDKGIISSADPANDNTGNSNELLHNQSEEK